MKGWILYTDYATKVCPERYELHRFMTEATRQNIKLKIVKPEQVDLVITNENIQKIYFEGKPVDIPDFVLPRMGAGTTYPALTILKHLEKNGVFMLNSCKGVEYTKDKLLAHLVLVENNIPTPKTLFMKFPIDTNIIEKHLKFPVIVKTVTGSQGYGVLLSKDKKDLKDLTMLLDNINNTNNIIIQEYITTSIGRDLRALVIGNEVKACMERISRKGDFKANFSMGGKVKKFKISPEIENLLIKTTKALNLNIAGIDLLFGKNCFYVCEASSAPGFKGLESCCNINVPEETFNYIRTKI